MKIRTINQVIIPKVILDLLQSVVPFSLNTLVILIGFVFLIKLDSKLSLLN